MTEQPRRSTSASVKKSSPLAGLVLVAGKALSDPRVRAAFLEVSGDIVDGVRTWNANRQEPKTSRRERVRSVNRFGHAGLALRAQRLGDLVAGLRESSALPAAAGEALGEFQKAVDLINLRLQLAAALPWAKRLTLHREIDDALDDLEEILATIGRPAPSLGAPGE